MSGDTGRNKMEVEMLQGFDLKVASATLHQPLHVHLCQNKHAAGTHFVCVCVCVCVCLCPNSSRGSEDGGRRPLCRL